MARFGLAPARSFHETRWHCLYVEADLETTSARLLPCILLITLSSKLVSQTVNPGGCPLQNTESNMGVCHQGPNGWITCESSATQCAHSPRSTVKASGHRKTEALMRGPTSTRLVHILATLPKLRQLPASRGALNATALSSTQDRGSQLFMFTLRSPLMERQSGEAPLRRPR